MKLIYSFFVFMVLFGLKPQKSADNREIIERTITSKEINAALQSVIFLDEKGDFQTAEYQCDTIIKKVENQNFDASTNDVLMEIYTYKAIYLQEKEQIVSANDYFEKSLLIFEKSSKKNAAYLAFIYPKLGNNYAKLGDYEKALILHQKMLQIAIAKKDLETEVQSYINLSIALQNQGKVAEAILILEKAIPKLQAISSERKALVFSNYGSLLFQSKNNNQQAINFLFKAEKELKQNKTDTYILAGVYKNLGEIYATLNLTKKAVAFYHLAITNYKKSTVNRKREIAKTYLLIYQSNTIENQQNYLDSTALALTNKDLKRIKVENLYAENTFIPLFELAISQEKNPIQKLNYYTNIFKVQQLIRSEYLFEEAKFEILQNGSEYLDAIFELCNQLYVKNSDESYLYTAFDFLESTKSILLIEEMLKQTNASKIKDYQRFKVEIKTQKALLISSNQEKNREQSKAIEAKIKQLTFDFNLQNQYLTDVEKLSYKPINALAFQKHILAKDEMILNYFEGKNSVYNLCLTKDKISLKVILKDSVYLNDLQDFKQLFKFENRYAFNRQLAEKMGNYLLPKNIKKGSKIIVFTDKLLNDIPFEALVYKHKYFIENGDVYYAFSVNLLSLKREKKNSKNEIISFAPIFEDLKEKKLSASENELHSIHKILKGKSFLREEANSAQFLDLAKEYSIIHISTHAKIDTQLQTASIDFYDKSLFFSQIKEEQFQANLLVLSACETGIGEHKIGEGSMSLARSFAYTGIPSVVSSLWKVNESSSVAIFEEFYKNIAQNATVSFALNNAKRKYLNNKAIAEEKKQPYFWATFVLVGQDNILKVDKNSSFPTILFSIVTILTIGFLGLSLYSKKRK
jgi:CHAT domain-containing protein